MSGESMKGASRAAAQQRVLDGIVGAFAVWTLACHATLLIGGSLRLLLPLSAALGAAALFLYRRLRQTPAGAAVPCEPEPAAGGGPERLPLLLALAAALLTAATDRMGRIEPFCAGAILLMGAACLCRRTPDVSGGEGPGNDTDGVPVWLLAAAAALLSLLINRPDLDDCYHAGVATFAADAPGHPIMGRPNLIFGEPPFFWLIPVWRLQTLELAAGALSWLTGLPSLAVLHLVVGPAAAFLSVLAVAALARRLLPGRAFWVVLVWMLCLMADGERNASFGNFAFVRIHQGKAIFLTAVVPLIMACGIDLAARPTRGAFARLAAAQIAALGLSSTAIWCAPLAAAFAMLAVVPLRRCAIRPLALGALASLYPPAAALALAAPTRSLIARMPEMDYPSPVVLPSAFLNTLGNSPWSLTALFFVLTAWLVVPGGLARRFCARLPLLFFLLLFNPLAMKLAGAAVVGGRLYYRTVWLVQVPLLCALVLTSPLPAKAWDRGARWTRIAILGFPLLYASFIHDPPWWRLLLWRVDQEWFARAAAWNLALFGVLAAVAAFAVARSPAPRRPLRVFAVVIGAAALLWCLPVRPVLCPANALFDTELRFGRPGLKVDREAYRMAEAINANVPPGAPVLAPHSVAPWVTTFHRHALPLMARLDHIGCMAVAMGPDETRRRLDLMTAAGGPSDGPYTRSVTASGYQDLTRFAGRTYTEPTAPAGVLNDALADYGLKAVCLTLPPRRDVVDVLEASGFRGWRLDNCPRYGLWLKPEPEAQKHNRAAPPNRKE